jgi:hypothetical protein
VYYNVIDAGCLFLKATSFTVALGTSSSVSCDKKFSLMLVMKNITFCWFRYCGGDFCAVYLKYFIQCVIYGPR